MGAVAGLLRFKWKSKVYKTLYRMGFLFIPESKDLMFLKRIIFWTKSKHLSIIPTYIPPRWGVKKPKLTSQSR